MTSSAPTRKSGSRLARYAGLGLAAMGLSHFTSPGVFEPITKPAFPRRTRQHVYTNGGIETALGLGLATRKTRRVALVGVVGYLAYLGRNTARNAR